jgi:DNA polymerase I-like protein with 3'-5' exonuclease and polymerase domains
MKPATQEAYQLFHDGAAVLARMEHNGFRIDMGYLQKAMDDTHAKITELTAGLQRHELWKDWQRTFGDKTKLDSRPQLAEMVYGKLGFECHHYTEKLNQPDTSAEALAHIDHPFVRMYAELKTYQKVRETFLTGIRDEQVDGYLHPSFNLHKIITFRSSSESPNFQNLPARNQLASRIVRTAFIPREGRRIVETDFVGAEVRVGACYTQDPELIRYIEDPTKDMHRDTAVQLFVMKAKQYDDKSHKKTLRDSSKNMFVFPQFYGSVYFQCAPIIWDAMEQRDFRLTPEKTIREHLAENGIKKLGDVTPGVETKPGTFVHHVKKVEESFWNERFSTYTEWKKRYWRDYTECGYLNTLTGFLSQGVFRRNQVLNTAIQGSAFHCLLWSVIRLQKWLTRYKMKTKLIGQIHDSIVADVHPDEFDDYLAAVKQIITVDLRKHWSWIIVPMEIEAEATAVDASWYTKSPVAI